MEEVFYLKTISFNSNGGSSVPQQKLMMGETVARPSDPNKERAIFSGWYIDNDSFTDEWDFNISPESDITLYAKWRSVGISLSPGSINFGSEYVGYSAITPQTVEVKNISTDQSMENLTLSVSSSYFMVTPLGNSNLTNPGDFTTFTVAPVTSLSPGTYTAAVTVLNADGISASITVSFTVKPNLITNINLFITAPAKGTAPDAAPSSGTHTWENAGGSNTASINNSSNIDSVTWTPTVSSVFLASTAYTVRIVYKTDNSNYAIASTIAATINGSNAAVSNRTDSGVTLSFAFPATTAKTITGFTVSPPSNLNYTHGDSLNLSGLDVTLTYDDLSTEIVAYNNFASKNVSVNIAHNTVLSHLSHNNAAVSVSAGSYTQNVGTLSVSQKPLTIKSVSHTKYYDDNNNANGDPVVVTFNEPFVAGDDVKVNTVNAVYLYPDPGTKTIDVFSITLTGTDAINYTINETLPYRYLMTTGGITGGSQEFNISVAEISSGDINVVGSGLILSRTEAGGYSKSATISVSGTNANAARWYYDGNLQHTGASLLLSVSFNPEEPAYTAVYNDIKKHLITVVVTIDGIEYSRRIEFEVRQ